MGMGSCLPLVGLTSINCDSDLQGTRANPFATVLAMFCVVLEMRKPNGWLVITCYNRLQGL